MTLLTTANTKIKKGEKLGFMTFGIHLAPAKLSGFNVCPSASNGCAAACLNTAGMGVFSNVQKSRIEKTKFLFKDSIGFLNQLYKEISAAIRKAEKQGMKACFRLNLTSDLSWERMTLNGKTLFEHFPQVNFYDYSKVVGRMSAFLAGEMPSNYHLTFSRSEKNDLQVKAILASGGNVAMVFRKTLPEKFMNCKVVNGDESDLRFLDESGVIVGLVEKGLAKKDKSGFVLEPSEGGEA